MIDLFKVQTDTEACLKNLETVLESGYIGEGIWVERFEKELQALWQTENRVLAVNSCTSALELALHLCNVKGDDTTDIAPSYVITTPQTCTATNTAIVSRGGQILWADVDPFSGNITAESILRLIQMYGRKYIKAIICVDWSGTPVEYDKIREVALDIPIIEDAAHAFLTQYNGGHISQTGGDFVCFSFQAIKHLTTGDGGALIVPKHLEKRAELLRWYGLDRKSGASFRCAQTIQESGFKFHMNNLAACMGIANLETAKRGVEGSKQCAEWYSENLKIGKGVLYVPMYDERSSYWLYTILVEKRDQFISYLNNKGIAASPVHARNDKHPCFPPKESNPEARRGVDYFSEHNVSIPCGAWVGPAGIVDVIEAVNDWNKNV